MEFYPHALLQMIECFAKLPGIGEKTAARLAFNMLKWLKEDAEKFSESIMRVVSEINECKKCFGYTEKEELCLICKNEKRDNKLLCIVEEFSDLAAIEKTGDYNGYYFVLGGRLSPIKGIGPESIHIDELVKRVKLDLSIEELILATNPTVEGEATAFYIAKAVRDLNKKISRIAFGIPMGGDLEYTDKVTLRRAIEGRKTF